jgi:hypothetical protein
VMYEETIRATEDWFGDEHLAALFCTQPKTRTWIIDDPVQEFINAIEWLTQHAFLALHKGHVGRGPGKAFGDGIRNQDIKQ